jgi:hypothetical protein
MGFREQIARIIAGGAWPSTPAPGKSTDSSKGVGVPELSYFSDPFFKLSSERVSVYKDVLSMDASVEEVAVGLDMLADNACSSGDNDLPFQIVTAGSEQADASIIKLVTELMKRTKMTEKLHAITRELLLFGDYFWQYVIDKDLNIVRIMYMPPETMSRNEDMQGLLLNGEEKGSWAYEQTDPGTGTLLAGFKPYEIEHIRWGRSGRSRYGRSLLYTARTSWRKLQAMEEALVINWVTRAFARLLFVLDVTGKSDREAQDAIEEFKRTLNRKQITHGDDRAEQLSVVKDIFVGRSYREVAGKGEVGLTDVRVLDTSSVAYQNMSAIDYYRSKVLMAVRTPKAYLGLEADINAKATLVQEDRRYSRFIRRIQMVIGEAVNHMIWMQLLLTGMEPENINVRIQWPAESWSDIVEDSQAQANFAQADSTYLQMGVVDKEWIAMNHLRMTRAMWDQVSARVKADPPKLPEQAVTPERTGTKQNASKP